MSRLGNFIIGHAPLLSIIVGIILLGVAWYKNELHLDSGLTLLGGFFLAIGLLLSIARRLQQ